MPFAAMTTTDLQQTITIFNLFKNPDTGVMEYYRTILKNVRVDEVTTGLKEALRGDTRTHKIIIMADRRTTKGYSIDEHGIKFNKPYRPWPVWSELSATEKQEAWTWNQKHVLAMPNHGQKETIAPEFEVANDNWPDFMSRHGLRPIQSIESIIDDDGSVHSWEITIE